MAWCEYLQGHARRLYASATDPARVAAALLATQLAHGRLPSPFTARDVYRNEWTGLTEPRVVQGALEGLAELGWIRAEAVRARDGGRPTVRFRLNPRLPAGAGMPARAACLRRPPRAPDVAPGGTARLGFCQFCRFPAGLMIGGHTLVFNAARNALPTVLTGPLPG